jgi:ABC-type transport system involved in multi-copper enzyme maturation permease subunit
MQSLATAIFWDWFKLARRWMPWILLAVLILMSQLTIWGSTFAYRSLTGSGGSVILAAGPGRPPEQVECKDVLSGDAARLPSGAPPQVLDGLQAQCRQEQVQLARLLADEYDQIALPGSIVASLNLAVTVDLILLGILTVSHIGAEYGWGTVRPNLIRGIGRWQYTIAKLILLALLAAGSLLVVVAATVVSSLIARGVAPPPAQFASATTWAKTSGVLLKSWTGLIPFIAFAGFATVLTRSTAAGMIISIGYRLAEGVIVGILGAIFSWVATLSHHLLGQNIEAWAGLSFLSGGAPAISDTHAAFALLAYTVVLVAASLYLFEIRDVTGPSGGG